MLPKRPANKVFAATAPPRSPTLLL